MKKRLTKSKGVEEGSDYKWFIPTHCALDETKAMGKERTQRQNAKWGKLVRR